MYKIGELSRIVDITIKTLRYYDEIGILSPSKIDNFTGYRYYNDESVIECELIKLLKSVNFTLEEIKEYKYNFSNDVLLSKQKEIIEEMEFLKKKYNRLQSMIEESKNTKPKTIIYKKIPKETNSEKNLRRKYERRNIRKYM